MCICHILTDGWKLLRIPGVDLRWFISEGWKSRRPPPFVSGIGSSSMDGSFSRQALGIAGGHGRTLPARRRGPAPRRTLVPRIVRIDSAISQRLTRPYRRASRANQRTIAGAETEAFHLAMYLSADAAETTSRGV